MRKIKWQKTLCIKNWWKTPGLNSSWLWRSTMNLQSHGKLNYIWPELRAYSLWMWWDKRDCLKLQENKRTKLSSKAVKQKQTNKKNNRIHKQMIFMSRFLWWIIQKHPQTHVLNQPDELFTEWTHWTRQSSYWSNIWLTYWTRKTLIKKITDWLFIWQCAVKYKDFK